MLEQRYQNADFYSGVPVCWNLLWRTSRLYDNFLGGLRQYQCTDYYFGVPVAGVYFGVLNASNINYSGVLVRWS